MVTDHGMLYKPQKSNCETYFKYKPTHVTKAVIDQAKNAAMAKNMAHSSNWSQILVHHQDVLRYSAMESAGAIISQAGMCVQNFFVGVGGGGEFIGLS